jgi:monoamine oxidase
MGDKSVLIVGAGAAGLAAAERLSKDGMEVIILEARERPGGRIYTVQPQGTNVPIELGAEFVHGSKNTTWELIRAAKLKTVQLQDQHWQVIRGEWKKDSEFWNELSELTESIAPNVSDEDFQSLLNRTHDLDEKTKWLAKEYVEGFHAADADRMSIHALKRAEDAAEKEGGTRQFRMAKGYADLIGWLVAQLAQANVRVLHNTIVKTIRWEPGHAEADAQTPGGLKKVYRGDAVVVTVPLGVLKAKEIVFDPELADKEEAINGLEMGSVVKVILQFRSQFWPRGNFGFAHSDEKWFPTWWTDERAPILTGWVGGPRVERLSKEGRDAIEVEAIGALARLLKIEAKKAEAFLVENFTHDWVNDRFSRGAYSYAPVGMVEMSNRLAAPVADTIYFAGEATDGCGNQGTVHGALASGRRAGEQVCEMSKTKTLKRTQITHKVWNR